VLDERDMTVEGWHTRRSMSLSSQPPMHSSQTSAFVPSSPARNASSSISSPHPPSHLYAPQGYDDLALDGYVPLDYGATAQNEVGMPGGGADLAPLIPQIDELLRMSEEIDRARMERDHLRDQSEVGFPCSLSFCFYWLIHFTLLFFFSHMFDSVSDD
jgi:hypothetical protein